MRGRFWKLASVEFIRKNEKWLALFTRLWDGFGRDWILGRSELQVEFVELALEDGSVRELGLILGDQRG